MQNLTQDQIDALMASTKLKGFTIEATVIRANGDVEPQGIVAGWNRNPFKNIVLKLKILRDRLRVLRNIH